MALEGNHAFAFLWALMSRKLEDSYFQIFHEFKNIAPHLKPSTISTDFEISLRKATRRAFTGVDLVECYFHYTQALVKKAKKYGILRKATESEDVKQLLRGYCVLALLPCQDIQSFFAKMYAATPMEVQTTFIRFHRYYTKQWIRRKKPPNFSVYNKLISTNNYCKSYRAQLLKKLGRKPEIWNFTDGIKSF